MAIPTLADLTQYRGAKTRALAGGVPFNDTAMLVSNGGSTITSWTVVQVGGTAGHWTTSSTTNSPTPATAGVSANLNGGPYTFTVTATNADGPSVAKTLTINIRANTYTVSSVADVSTTTGTRALRPVKNTLGGMTVEVAADSDTAWFGSGALTYDTSKAIFFKDFNAHTAGTRITVQNEDDANPGILGQISLNSCQRMDFVNLVVQGYLSASNSSKDNQATSLVTSVMGTSGASSLTFTGMTVGAPASANSPKQWLNGFDISGNTSFSVMCDGVTISQCLVSRVVQGFNPRTVSNWWGHHNIVDRYCVNAFFLAGAVNNGVIYEDIIHCRPFINPNDAGNHPDNLQSGIGSGVTGNYTNLTFRRIMMIYADGTFRAQGPFFNDIRDQGFFFNNVIIENIFYDGCANQGVFIDAGFGQTFVRSTIIRGDCRVTSDNRWEDPQIRQNQTNVTGLVSQSVFWSVSPFMQPAFYDATTCVDTITAFPLPGTITTVAACSAAIATYYATNNFFVNPDVSAVDYPNLTAQQISDALRLHYGAKQDGYFKNLDGTYKNALFPDGTWNDGTVYQSTPPTAITSSAQLATVEVGQPDTITFQLDAAANLAVTITPAKSGVTGSFSPATVVIDIGSASGTTDFTATSAGAASLTATNDRSLTNPAALPVTVTSPVNPPGSYTQALSVPAYSAYPNAISITYVLNQPAIADVTITPACTLAGSFVTGSTVVIPSGATSGFATFVPSATGPATFSATNDRSLTNPGTVATTVTATNLAQLIALGIRHSA